MAPSKKAGGGEDLPTLEEVLSDIGRRQTALGKLDLKLVDAVKALEEKLRGRVSTRVSTTIETTFQQGMEWADVLTFGKWDGKWQLLIETGEVGDPETWKTQPLVSASREKRVRVFTEGILEKLVRDAAAQLTEQMRERERALEIAGSLIGTLDAHTSGGDDE